MSITLRFPHFREKALTLSYDDGTYHDSRLMKILNENGIKCTFNLNSGLMKEKAQNGDRLSVIDAVKLYKNSGHEVAAHTYTHSNLIGQSRALITSEILKDREKLEDMFGTVVKGMAYPYGAYSDEIISCMKSCGIMYARTVLETKKFDLPGDWLRLPTTCHHNNKDLFELAEQFINEKRRPEWPPIMFYLWGHSYEFDADNSWEIIEKFAEKMGNRNDIWYATNIEICEYVTAYKRLQFSVKCDSVFNPTSTDLYVLCGGKEVILYPGKETPIA